MNDMSMKKERADALGDRMKAYERIETDQRFAPNALVYVRLDGRGFSRFTKGLARPWDKRLSDLMIFVTEKLVKEFNCLTGYTQSDEISLVIENKYESPMTFDAKKQKLLSVIAGYASSVFSAELANRIPEKAGQYPTFDCRMFEVPRTDAANAFLWREQDATKNSISMLAQHYFSHKELMGKNSKVKIEMLKTQKDVIWEDCPAFFKFGTYVKRVTRTVVNPQFPDAPAERHYVEAVPHTLNYYVNPIDRAVFVLSKYAPPYFVEQMGS